MLIKQKQQIDSYQRVQDFLRAHAPPESPGYVVQKKKFDDIVATLTVSRTCTYATFASAKSCFNVASTAPSVTYVWTRSRRPVTGGP